MEQAGSTQREKKHIAIMRAIERISDINRQMDIIINQIRGPQPQPVCEDNSKRPEITLSEFLDSAAEEIDKKIQAAHELLENLERLLF